MPLGCLYVGWQMNIETERAGSADNMASCQQGRSGSKEKILDV